MIIPELHSLLISLLNNAIEGIFILDINNQNIIYGNDKFLEIININDLKDFNSIIHPQDKKKFSNFITSLKKIKTKNKIIHIKVMKNYKIPIDVEIYGIPIRIENKTTHLLGILKDISIVKRFKKAFYDEPIDFKEISESIDDAICILQKNGKFIYVSPRLPTILGEKEIPSNFYDLVHPNDIPRIEEIFKKSIEDPSILYLKRFEFRAETSNNDYIWLEASSRKYYDDNGNVKGFIVVLRDINFRKQLEKKVLNYHRELEQKNKKLKELDRLKSAFLSNISHELRTPLSIIKGFTEFLLKGNSGNINSQQYLDLQVILRNTNKLIRLVDDLLDVSKIESGEFKIRKTKFDLVRLIKNCVYEMKNQIEKRNHIIEFYLPNRPLIINADKQRIHQLLTNLIENSIKYTPIGGLIQLHLYEEDNNIHFYIKDNGIGLSEDEIKQIFTRFGKIYMPDNVDKVDTEGTGLGLVICKNIVNAHGGKIWAESEGHDKGCEFHFVLPKN